MRDQLQSARYAPRPLSLRTSTCSHRLIKCFSLSFGASGSESNAAIRADHSQDAGASASGETLGSTVGFCEP